MKFPLVYTEEMQHKDDKTIHLSELTQGQCYCYNIILILLADRRAHATQNQTQTLGKTKNKTCARIYDFLSK